MANKAFMSSLRYTVSGWLIIILHLLAFIGVPILAYHFHNWLSLFGILFLYAGFRFGWKNYSTRIFVIAAIGIGCSILHYFAYFLVDIYFLCFTLGFVLMRLYRIIGLGDKMSKTLIATQNPDVMKEVYDDIEEEMKKRKVSK